MMTKIHKWTFIVIVLILGPSACENCPDTPKYFSIVGLNIFNGKYTSQESSPWREISFNEPVSWNEFSMRVGFEKTYYSQKETSAGASLYADCDNKGYLGSKIGVDTLYLVTLSEYNDGFHQNDTLNSIVLTNGASITSYIDLNRTHIKNDGFELKLTEPPSNNTGDYRFKLIFLLNDGEIFIEESNKVQLTL